MKRLRFLVALRIQEHIYQRINAIAAQTMAARLDVEVEILYAGTDAIWQSQQLLKAIQSPCKPDGILCSPVGTTLIQVARAAVSAHIGWAVLSRDVDYLDELRASATVPVFSVSIDHEEVGNIQARQISALLPNGGLVLCLLGPTGHPLSELRLRALLTAKPANIDLKTLTTDGTRQGASEVMTRWLGLQTPNTAPLSLVAGQTDEIAIGARQAFRDAGVQTDVPFLGSLFSPENSPQWLRRRWLTASIVNPTTADVALQAMVWAIRSHAQPAQRILLAPSSQPEIEELSRNPAPSGWIERLEKQELALRPRREV